MPRKRSTYAIGQGSKGEEHRAREAPDHRDDQRQHQDEDLGDEHHLDVQPEAPRRSRGKACFMWSSEETLAGPCAPGEVARTGHDRQEDELLIVARQNARLSPNIRLPREPFSGGAPEG